MDNGFLKLKKLMAEGSAAALDPEEIYVQWEYTFLRLGLVDSPKAFAEMPIPCTLDLIERIHEEFKEVKS